METILAQPLDPREINKNVDSMIQIEQSKQDVNASNLGLESQMSQFKEREEASLTRNDRSLTPLVHVPKQPKGQHVQLKHYVIIFLLTLLIVILPCLLWLLYGSRRVPLQSISINNSQYTTGSSTESCIISTGAFTPPGSMESQVSLAYLTYNGLYSGPCILWQSTTLTLGSTRIMFKQYGVAQVLLFISSDTEIPSLKTRTIKYDTLTYMVDVRYVCMFKGKVFGYVDMLKTLLTPDYPVYIYSIGYEASLIAYPTLTWQADKYFFYASLPVLTTSYNFDNIPDDRVFFTGTDSSRVTPPVKQVLSVQCRYAYENYGNQIFNFEPCKSNHFADWPEDPNYASDPEADFPDWSKYENINPVDPGPGIEVDDTHQPPLAKPANRLITAYVLVDKQITNNKDYNKYQGKYAVSPLYYDTLHYCPTYTNTYPAAVNHMLMLL